MYLFYVVCVCVSRSHYLILSSAVSVVRGPGSCVGEGAGGGVIGDGDSGDGEIGEDGKHTKIAVGGTREHSVSAGQPISSSFSTSSAVLYWCGCGQSCGRGLIDVGPHCVPAVAERKVTGVRGKVHEASSVLGWWSWVHQPLLCPLIPAWVAVLETSV